MLKQFVKFCLNLNILSNQNNLRLGLPGIPFQMNVECVMADCGCPQGSNMDDLWQTGMCIRVDEECDDVCVSDDVQYQVYYYQY